MNGLTDFIESIAPNVWEIRERVLESTWETIYMILVSALIAGIIGIIIGVILVITKKTG